VWRPDELACAKAYVGFAEIVSLFGSAEVR
jgi:hypothetical protein